MLEERANRQCSCGSGETVPQFTFSLFKDFVNSICSVSTGFFRFFPVFVVQRQKKWLFCGILCAFGLLKTSVGTNLLQVPRAMKQNECVPRTAVIANGRTTVILRQRLRMTVGEVAWLLRVKLRIRGLVDVKTAIQLVGLHMPHLCDLKRSFRPKQNHDDVAWVSVE